MGNLHDFPNAFHADFHFLGDFFRRRFTSELLQELTGYANQFVNGFYHMYRNADGTSLVRNSTGDGLTNPPGCIGTELIALGVIEFFNGLDKPQITFLNQIEEQHPTAHITLGNADHQTEVGFCQTFLGDFIAFLHALGQCDFFISRKQRHTADFLQVHADGVINTDAFGH